MFSPELLKFIMEYDKENIEKNDSTQKEIYFSDRNRGHLAKVYITVPNK